MQRGIHLLYGELDHCKQHCTIVQHCLRYCCRGYNIGIRLIDEFLANSKTTKCGDFRDTAEKIAKVHLPAMRHA